MMLCFVLDLRSLSPPLLEEIKQSLLQLANFCAISSLIGERPHLKPLSNRFGLSYIINNQISGASELKVAYNPRGEFRLSDFHHAVTNLQSDVFLPTYNSSGDVSCADLKLSSILSDEVLYSWKGDDKDFTRKVILIGSNFAQNLDSVTEETLLAADKCVSVDFLLIKQKSSHLCEQAETINKFDKQISELENCSFREFFPDVFPSLVKQWLQDLKDDVEEPLQARFIFKRGQDPLKQIYCNLCLSYSPMIDGLTTCQTCRCYGMPVENRHEHRSKRSCPHTCNDLESPDIFDNSVKVGEQTVLSSFWCCSKLQQASSPVDFKVIERTNLGSLSEGVILGPSYIVTPSSCPESDESDMSKLTAEIFQGLCNVLHSLSQGLVCSSNCNIETLKQTSFRCYYILSPSDKGLMLLRRLAGSEEVVPTLNVHQLITPSAECIENSVLTSLLKMKERDYNPVLHERGFHQKLNALVKESLQLRIAGVILHQRQRNTKDRMNMLFPEICVLDDCLSIVHMIGGGVETHIWCMRTYGDEDSWKELVAPLPVTQIRNLRILEEDSSYEVICSDDGRIARLTIYQDHSYRYEYFETEGCPDVSFDVGPIVEETMISPFSDSPDPYLM